MMFSSDSSFSQGVFCLFIVSGVCACLCSNIGDEENWISSPPTTVNDDNNDNLKVVEITENNLCLFV